VDVRIPRLFYSHFHGWEVTLLSDLNGHPRDSRLRFVAESHKYFIDGMETLGSVTGVVHRFAQDFDADRVSAAMMAGRIPGAYCLFYVLVVVMLIWRVCISCAARHGA
jgi:hypothetical protein